MVLGAHSIQTQSGCHCIYEFIIFFTSSPPPALEPAERREKRRGKKKKEREMIVIQGHGSKEVYPQEQIQNILCNRIATPK